MTEIRTMGADPLRLGGHLDGGVALSEALRHGDAAPQGASDASDDHDGQRATCEQRDQRDQQRPGFGSRVELPRGRKLAGHVGRSEDGSRIERRAQRREARPHGLEVAGERVVCAAGDQRFGRVPCDVVVARELAA